MFTLHALEAYTPLTKTFTLAGEKVEKSNYPNVFKFTSHDHQIKDITGFYKALLHIAAEGQCILKGSIKTPLVNQSRAGATSTDDTTHWLVLDLDGLTGFKSVEEFMSQHPNLNDVSYIVQYSSQSGLPDTKGIHAHIYIIISHLYNAPYLKGWLTKQNVDGSILSGTIKEQLTLNRTQSVLHYPIDITACQNDKLIYVAPPTIGKGVKYKEPKDGFIQLVKKTQPVLPVERLEHGTPEKQKQEAKNHFNTLRVAAGLKPVTGRTKIDKVTNFEIEPDCGQFVITGQRGPDRGFIYFNMNGGDSWSWWHPERDHNFIHCFKDGRTYLTQNILPDYFRQCEARRKESQMTPSPDGIIPLGFRDLRSCSYWHGMYDPASNNIIELYQCRTEAQIDSYLQQHGKPEGVIDYVPQWKLEFNPQSDVVCSVEDRYLNTYAPSSYFTSPRNPVKSLHSQCPIIEHAILSVVSSNAYSELTEHWLNWLAVIFQQRIKTRIAWVFSGVEGTGKGMIFDKVLAPLFNINDRNNPDPYVQEVLMSQIEDDWNGWLERRIIVAIDEAQVSASEKKLTISQKLRNYITEDKLVMNNRFQSQFSAQSFVNFLIFSNKRDPVDMSASDRRFNCGDWQDTRWLPTDKEVKVDLPKELPYFMDYIMQRGADAEMAGTLINSKSRQNIIMANLNSLDMLADALIDGNLNPFIEVLPDLSMLLDIAGVNSAIGVQYARIITRELHELTRCTKPDPEDGLYKCQSRLGRDEIFILFEHSIGKMPSSPAKFARLLSHKNIELKKMRINDHLTMGIDVTWIASKEWVAENRVPDPAVPVKLPTNLTRINAGPKKARISK